MAPSSGRQTSWREAAVGLGHGRRDSSRLVALAHDSGSVELGWTIASPAQGAVTGEARPSTGGPDDRPGRSLEGSKPAIMAATDMAGGTSDCKRHVCTLGVRSVVRDPRCGSFLSMMGVYSFRLLAGFHTGQLSAYSLGLSEDSAIRAKEANCGLSGDQDDSMTSVSGVDRGLHRDHWGASEPLVFSKSL